jgi:hypothetical protein
MSSFVRTAVSTGVPFGILMGVYNVTLMHDDPIEGLVMGAAAGIAFGFAMAFVARHQGKKLAELRPAYEAEGLVFDGVASLALGWRKVPGSVLLTKQQLVFVPSRQTQSLGVLKLPLAEIASATARAGWTKQIEIATRTGATHRLVVEDPSVLAERIRLTQAPAAPTP